MMDIHIQEKRLMMMIEGYHKSECQSLLSSAHEKMAKKLQKAFHKARVMVHASIVSERKRTRELIHIAQAGLETKRRKHSIQADAMILEIGFKCIKQQLLNSWHNSNSRQLWINTALQAALKNLPAGDWQLHHPIDWSTEECQRVIEMTRLHSINVFFQVNAEIRSGIRIEAATTILDMTEQGLLVDKQRLESRLLALFYQVSQS